MDKKPSNVYAFKTHFEAENAVRLLGLSGFDMRHLSVIGRGYHSEEHPIGFYTKGDRIRALGKFGAFWGAVWGLLFAHLRRFAEQHYATSDIKQSSPSLVLQLNHIKFDLVPAIKAWGTTYQIPDGPSAWQNTNPNDFNGQLETINQKEMYKIKPMIRLLKYWNAEAEYVFDAYSLEKFVISLSYYGVSNIRDYLFTAFDNIYLGSDQAQWRKDKLKRAKEIISEVRSLESNGYPSLAEKEVKKLISSG